MKKVKIYTPIQTIAHNMRETANLGVWDGSSVTQYFDLCKWKLLEFGVIAIFTRDQGHHSCGWFKNPEYEQCYHLSLSNASAGFTWKILKALYGDNHTKVWSEPPHSAIGKTMDVWHYRLFCSQFWIPIQPRKEVYSKDLTEIGWKSFSEVQAMKNFNF